MRLAKSLMMQHVAAQWWVKNVLRLEMMASINSERNSSIKFRDENLNFLLLSFSKEKFGCFSTEHESVWITNLFIINKASFEYNIESFSYLNQFFTLLNLNKNKIWCKYVTLINVANRNTSKLNVVTYFIDRELTGIEDRKIIRKKI